MLREILLTNYKMFKGVTCISVATPPLSPITVISAASNSGKTTILDAVHWCLFGEGLFDNGSNYKDFDRLNRDAFEELNDGISTIVAVSLTFTQDGSTLKLRREQRFKKEYPSPQMVNHKVFINESEASFSEYREKINDIADPRSIFTYFVFSDIVEHRGTQFIAKKISNYVMHQSDLFEKFSSKKRMMPIDTQSAYEGAADGLNGSLLQQKEIADYFNSTVPAALNGDSAIGHTLVICSDKKLLNNFISLLGNSIQGRKINRVESDTKLRMGDEWSAFTNLNELDICVQDVTTMPTDTDSKKHIQSALTDFFSNIQIGKGPGARLVRLDLPQFTFMATASSKSEVPKAFLSLFENIIEIKATEPVCEQNYSELLYSRILNDANSFLKIMRNDECRVELQNSSFRLITEDSESQERWGTTTDSLSLNLALILAYQERLNSKETDGMVFPMMLDDFWNPCIDFEKFNFKGFIDLLSKQQLVLIVLDGNNEEQLIDQSCEVGLKHRFFRGEYILN